MATNWAWKPAPPETLEDLEHPVVPTARIDLPWKLQDWETATTPQVICEITGEDIACSISFYSRHHQANPEVLDSWVVSIHSTKYPENDKFGNSERFPVTDGLRDDLAQLRYWITEEFHYLRQRIREYEQHNEAAMSLFQALVDRRA